MIVKPGEKIKLDATLDDFDTTKFIRVILEDITGTPLSESPIGLTHIGGGRYFDNSVIKKVGCVNALFEVFNDAPFTDKNADFKEGIENFIDPPFFTVLKAPLEIEIEEKESLTLELGINESIDIEISNIDELDIEIGNNVLNIEITQKEALTIDIGVCE